MIKDDKLQMLTLFPKFFNLTSIRQVTFTQHYHFWAGYSGKMRLFTFRTDAGHYELIWGVGTNISSFQNMIAKAILLADINLEHYFTEV